jgi:hypothetical protein
MGCQLVTYFGYLDKCFHNHKGRILKLKKKKMLTKDYNLVLEIFALAKILLIWVQA